MLLVLTVGERIKIFKRIVQWNGIFMVQFFARWMRRSSP